MVNAIFGGPVFFQTVRTACQLDLFGLLKRNPGLTRQEIANHLKVDEYPARILLLTLVTLNLLKKSGNRYRCRRLAGIFLDKHSPRSAVSTLEWMHHIVYPSMFHYFESVSQRRPAGLQVFQGDENNLYGRLAHNPELEQVFHEAMQARSRSTNVEFVRTVKFSKFNRILDVGGGNGENLLTIAKSHPNVTGTLLDFPSVAETAAKRFRDQGLGDRLQAFGANILAEDFPKGHNCILFCHMTPIFSEETNRSFLKKAHDALEPGGIVCIYTTFMNNNESGPLLSALLSPYFLCTVNGQGRHYSWAETSSWLQDTGFMDITTAKLIRGDGVVLGFKP
jgi:ubiquinone/menaquinone biosynthesis C-methylase UbiE